MNLKTREQQISKIDVQALFATWPDDGFPNLVAYAPPLLSVLCDNHAFCRVGYT